VKHHLRDATALALAGVLLLSPGPAEAQSVLLRTPNLSGGWVGNPGVLDFTFLHRFTVIDIQDGEDRVVNTPTFLLGYSFANVFLVGVQYSSSSRTVPDKPNEREVLVRVAPFKPSAELPLEFTLTGAYNAAAESVDGELAVGVPLGPATVMGTLRGFSDGYGADESRLALGAGLRLRLTDNLSLAGDFVTPTDKREDEEFGWGAALQLAIPFTPHTLSLQATNTTTSTLQGSSRRALAPFHGTRYGFEFTVPITLSRYLGRGGGARDQTVTADTVTVAIRDFEFAIQRLTVRPGTTIVWVNEGNVPHTSSSDADLWDSPMLAPGESYARVFEEAGEYPYHCEPHPFMTAVVVVQPGG